MRLFPESRQRGLRQTAIGIDSKNIPVGPHCLFLPPILFTDAAQQDSSRNVIRFHLDRLPAVRQCQFLVSPLAVDFRHRLNGPGPPRRELACRVQFFNGPLQSPKFPVDNCQVYSINKVPWVNSQSFLIQPRSFRVLCQRPSLSLYFAKLNKNLHQPKCWTPSLRLSVNIVAGRSLRRDGAGKHLLLRGIAKLMIAPRLQGLDGD